jgi:hypothetical protein
MKSDRRFLKPIILKDGAVVEGLADAQTLIHNLSATIQQGARWKYASELVSRALEKDDKYSAMEARSQVERALKEDGLA